LLFNLRPANSAALLRSRHPIRAASGKSGEKLGRRHIQDFRKLTHQDSGYALAPLFKLEQSRRRDAEQAAQSRQIHAARKSQLLQPFADMTIYGVRMLHNTL
jgi:hypothetical protein